MFEAIHSDSCSLSAALDLRPDTLVVFSETDQLLDSDVFRQLEVFPLDRLPNFPCRSSEFTPVLKRFRSEAGDVLQVACRPRMDGEHGPHAIAYVMRLLGHLGVRFILFVERTCHITPDLDQDVPFFLVEDYVNFMGSNPLVGPNQEAWGPRFPDMSRPFDPGFSHMVSATAEQTGRGVKRAVYAGFLPHHLVDMERCEVQMLKAGASLAGTSLVQEVILARHMGVRVCALACPPSHPGILPTDMLLLIAKGMAGLT